MKNFFKDPMVKAVLLRWLRVFVQGSLANMAVISSASVDISTWADLNRWILALVVGFVAGGIAAIDKAWRWQP